MPSRQSPSYQLEPLEPRALFSAPPVTAFASAMFQPMRRVRAQPATATFAVIGDYGFGTGSGEGPMAQMVRSWNPEFIITTGDNNYPDGAASTIDRNIGQYFHEFIAPYKGRYGPGADRNRFFPTLGNHDWKTTSGGKPYLRYFIAPNKVKYGSTAHGRRFFPGPNNPNDFKALPTPYLDYFTLPGNERYYEFVRGPVHFFAIDSDVHEPHGVSAGSRQGRWLKARLAASTSPFRIVYFHHPPFSSGEHGDTPYMQWPFRQWGADGVLAGHDHDYERIMRDGFPYIVNGAGAGIRGFEETVEGSVVRFAGFGAMLVRATRTSVRFQFYTSPSGRLIDDFTLGARAHAPAKRAATARAAGAAAQTSVPAPARVAQGVFSTQPPRTLATDDNERHVWRTRLRNILTNAYA